MLLLLFCLVLVYDFDWWRRKHDNVIIVIGVILIDLTNWIVVPSCKLKLIPGKTPLKKFRKNVLQGFDLLIFVFTWWIQMN